MSPKKRNGLVLFMRRVTPVVVLLFTIGFISILNFRNTPVAQAATSNTINFQARLQTASGAIVPDGMYNIEFKIYSASTGGSALWTEDYYNNAGNGLTTVNGYFSANLGSLTAFSGIKWDQQLWMTMNVGGTSTGTPTLDGEMTPRLTLTAVPYAFTAGQLSNTSGANTSSLTLQAPTVGTQNFVIQDQGAAGTYNILTAPNGTDGYIKLQTASPGTQQTGNLNISGAGLFGSLKSSSLDTVSAGTLALGASNATTINIGGTTTTSVGFAIGGTTVASIGANGATLFKNSTNSSSAFVVQNATSQNIFAIDNSANTISLGNGLTNVTITNSGVNKGWTTNANSTPSAVRGQSTVTANGYIYSIGGFSGGSYQSTVTYAKLNADGSTGTWTTSGNSLPATRGYASAITANGYIYLIGGDNGSIQSTVFYAKLNADGSTGAWATSANSLQLVRAYGNATIANGYIYFVGGYSSSYLNTTTYAKLNADGSIGSWTTSGVTLPNGISEAGLAGANNYLYLVGGYSGSANQSAAYSTKLNADGSIGSWTTSANSLPSLRTDFEYATANGYMYVMGGDTGGVYQSSVYYSKLNADGTFSTWNTSANSLPDARQDGSAAAANGYVYVIGGRNSSASQSTVYYSSLQTTSIAGNTVFSGSVSGLDAANTNEFTTLGQINGLVGSLVSNTASNYIQLQGATPGTAQTGNINVSGTIIGSSVLAGSLDTAAAGTLTIGGANATTTNISNNNANHTINIGTGSGTQAITIGGTGSGSSTIIQGGTGGLSLVTPSSSAIGFYQNSVNTLNLDTSGRAIFKPIANDGSSFLVQNATGGSVLIVDTTNNQVGTGALGQLYAGGGGILADGALTLRGTTATTYTTPLGATLTTKINIPNYNPGAYNQIIAFGLSASADTNARAILIADNRAGAHQPTIGVLSPDENQIFGLSWEGSGQGGGTSTTAYLKNSANNISLQVNGVNALTATNNSGSGLVTIGGSLITGTGSTFTNGGGTINSVVAISNKSSGGAIGTAATTVDVATQFNVSQTSSGQTLSLPSPSGGAVAGRIVYVTNIGSATFTMGTSSIAQGNTGIFIWYGTGWATTGIAGGTGDYIQNTTSPQATSNFNISGKGVAGVGFQSPSLDTAAAGTLTVGGTNATTLTLDNTGSGASAVNVGSVGSGNKTVAVGTTTSGSTTTISGGTGSSAVVLQAGSGGGVTVGSTSNAQVVKVGNTVGTSSLALSAGTGNISITGATTVTGSLTIAGGSTFTNASSTLNTALSFTGISASGPIAANTASVDIATTLNVTTTAASLTLSIPSPTVTTAGRVVYVSNAGATFSFKIGAVIVSPGTTAIFLWNGTVWTSAGIDGTGANYIQNTTAVQGSNFNVQASTSGSVAGVLQANASGSGDILDLLNGSGVTVGSIGSTGNVLFKAAASTTAFQVQNASSVSMFNIDTSTGTITLGAGGNTVTFTAAGGLVASGTAQHGKAITVSAEYAGAVLDAASDTACSSANAGTLTSGFDSTNSLNYYNWTSTNASAQCYDVIVQVVVPSDFSSWNGAPSIITYNSVGTDTTSIVAKILNNGTADTNYSSYVGVSSGTSIANNSMTSFGSTYTTGSIVTLKLRVTSNSSKNVRIGTISLPYNSKF